MKRCIPLMTVVVLLFGVLQTGAAFQPPANNEQDSAKPEAPLETLPPLPAPAKPGDPAPAGSSARGKKLSGGEVHAANAERFIQEGRIDLAIQAASQAINSDPAGAAAYRRIRARAYQLSGRYEEALADSNPLEVVVAADRANLKSAADVVAEVPKGAVLSVSQINGEWLKVDSVGEQKFKWAWVWKGNLVRSRPRRVQVEVIVPRTRIDINLYRRNYGGRYYGGIYIGPRYYGYGARYPGYGRSYYDWWGHVPPRYWRYLP